MGTLKTLEKKPIQRKSPQSDLPFGKTAQPPAFQLKAEEEKQPVQRQEAPEVEKEAPEQAVAAEQEPVNEKSDAERLRDAVAGKAEEWEGKEFITQQEIEDTRVKYKMKNYTTCLEFAGKMMRDAAKEVYGKDWKLATATALEFSQTKIDWEQAVTSRIQSDAFKKSAEMFQKGIKRIEDKKAEYQEEVDSLRKPQAEGENDLVYKQRLKRADALKKHAIGALDSAIRQLTAQRDKWQGRSDKSKEKAENLDANNTAMIKAQDGMTNGRPNPGEFIILAQAGKGADYGVSKATQVFLHGGTFKHIATFMGVVEKDKGSGFELWRTIDGGGTKGKETLLRVRLADRKIFPGAPGVKLPDAGSASGSQLAGWMDMEEMVRKRDEKLAAKKK